jgi:iron only hydrogenase large subunit-like protein
MNIITVNKDKCVNCHRCIAVCPVKYCNNARSSYIEVDNNLCIQCGRCVHACKHDARGYYDDFDDFITRPHENLIFIVDSSYIACFGHNFKKFLYFLKNNLKGRKIYDAGAGGEIIAMKYLEAIDQKKLTCVISQQCPVVVKYIETYKYKLINNLVPVDSPALAIARYIREYNSFNGEIAFISPCIAKSVEFRDENTNKYINYNLTYPRILQYIQNKKIDITNMLEDEFSDFEAEKGTGLGRPGGLKEVILKYRNIPAQVTHVEGDIIYEEYFDDLIKNLETGKPVPLIIDALNCSRGCNYGPATVKNFNKYEVDFFIDNQIADQQKKLGGQSKIDKYYKGIKSDLGSNPFERKYSRKPFSFESSSIKDEDLAQIYLSMHKVKPEDFQQCRECGYRTCKEMAIAIKLGLNKKENCFFYLQYELRNKVDIIDRVTRKVTDSIESIMEKIKNLKMIFDEILSSYNITHETLIDVNKSNEILVKLSLNFTPIVEAITDISDQTHLLSLNAAIEAARAGTAGKGFAIVAIEVDILSSKASEEVEKITPMVKDLIEKINQINKRGEVVIQDLEGVNSTLDTFSGNIETISTLMEDISENIRSIY